MKHARLLLLIAALTMALALPAAAQEPVTITISTWAGADEAAELQELIDEVNAENTDFQIVQEPIPGDYYTTVKTQPRRYGRRPVLDGPEQYGAGVRRRLPAAGRMPRGQ